MALTGLEKEMSSLPMPSCSVPSRARKALQGAEGARTPALDAGRERQQEATQLAAAVQAAVGAGALQRCCMVTTSAATCPSTHASAAKECL